MTSLLEPIFIGEPEGCPQCGALIVDSRYTQGVEKLRMACGAVWIYSAEANVSKPIEPCLDAFDNGLCPG